MWMYSKRELTKDEIIKEIERLRELDRKGEITVNQAMRLSELKKMQNTINRAASLDLW